MISGDQSSFHSFITLEILEYDIECAYDFIHIYDGQTVDDELLGVLSGKSSNSTNLPHFIAQTGFMLVALIR